MTNLNLATENRLAIEKSEETFRRLLSEAMGPHQKSELALLHSLPGILAHMKARQERQDDDIRELHDRISKLELANKGSFSGGAK